MLTYSQLIDPPRSCRQLYSAESLGDVPLATGNHGVEGNEELACGGDDCLWALPRTLQALTGHDVAPLG